MALSKNLESGIFLPRFGEPTKTVSADSGDGTASTLPTGCALPAQNQAAIPPRPFRKYAARCRRRPYLERPIITLASDALFFLGFNLAVKNALALRGEAGPYVIVRRLAECSTVVSLLFAHPPCFVDITREQRLRFLTFEEAFHRKERLCIPKRQIYASAGPCLAEISVWLESASGWNQRLAEISCLAISHKVPPRLAEHVVATIYCPLVYLSREISAFILS